MLEAVMDIIGAWSKPAKAEHAKTNHRSNSQTPVGLKLIMIL